MVVLSAEVNPKMEDEVHQAGIQFFEPKPLMKQRLLQILWQVSLVRTPPSSPRLRSPASEGGSEASFVGQVLTHTGAAMLISGLSSLPLLHAGDADVWTVDLDLMSATQFERETQGRLREGLQKLAATGSQISPRATPPLLLPAASSAEQDTLLEDSAAASAPIDDDEEAFHSAGTAESLLVGNSVVAAAAEEVRREARVVAEAGERYRIPRVCNISMFSIFSYPCISTFV